MLCIAARTCCRADSGALRTVAGMDRDLADQLPPLDVVDTFAFGGPMTVPAHACALLRACAVRAGWSLLDASRLDLTAAAVGAHLWASRFDAGSISHMADATPDHRHNTIGQATRAARRVLLRASGTPLWLPPSLQTPRRSVRWFAGSAAPAHVVRAARWAAAQVTVADREQLTARVSEDLDTGDRDLTRSAAVFARQLRATRR